MFSCTKDDRLWFGLVAFVVGAVVLLQRFEVVPAETWNYLWPSILVVSGLKWMVGSSSPVSACDPSDCCDCGSGDCSCDLPAPVVAKKMGKKNKKKA
ncbi:hypothetical protein IPG41_07240 [Candidatus Peregrinibacteria bacterium]|nr:MAG: hypothetical protein IPG41_07240 [Candidatus Peregrinibacteria bacterium]